MFRWSNGKRSHFKDRRRPQELGRSIFHSFDLSNSSGKSGSFLPWVTEVTTYAGLCAASTAPKNVKRFSNTNHSVFTRSLYALKR